MFRSDCPMGLSMWVVLIVNWYKRYQLYNQCNLTYWRIWTFTNHISKYLNEVCGFRLEKNCPPKRNPKIEHNKMSSRYHFSWYFYQWISLWFLLCSLVKFFKGKCSFKSKFLYFIICSKNESRNLQARDRTEIWHKVSLPRIRKINTMLYFLLYAVSF